MANNPTQPISGPNPCQFSNSPPPPPPPPPPLPPPHFLSLPLQPHVWPLASLTLQYGKRIVKTQLNLIY